MNEIDYGYITTSSELINETPNINYNFSYDKLKSNQICQSCGLPLKDKKNKNIDYSFNYCYWCYEQGKFINSKISKKKLFYRNKLKAMFSFRYNIFVKIKLLFFYKNKSLKSLKRWNYLTFDNLIDYNYQFKFEKTTQLNSIFLEVFLKDKSSLAKYPNLNLTTNDFFEGAKLSRSSVLDPNFYIDSEIENLELIIFNSELGNDLLNPLNRKEIFQTNEV